jgi:hypothetical protein
MEATCSPDILVQLYQTTWHHITETVSLIVTCQLRARTVKPAEMAVLWGGIGEYTHYYAVAQ